MVRVDAFPVARGHDDQPGRLPVRAGARSPGHRCHGRSLHPPYRRVDRVDDWQLVVYGSTVFPHRCTLCVTVRPNTRASPTVTGHQPTLTLLPPSPNTTKLRVLPPSSVTTPPGAFLQPRSPAYVCRRTPSRRALLILFPICTTRGSERLPVTETVRTRQSAGRAFRKSLSVARLFRRRSSRRFYRDGRRLVL